MEAKIIHIDMDAFYASVEQRDHPALRGLPVIVGGSPEKRGVVSAASYEARAYGVHSAMPTSQARRLCPQGIFLPVRMDRYRQFSDQVFAILETYTPLIEPLSLDECFLDVTGSERMFGPALGIARQIKKKIFEATGLTASAGIAPNKFLAKIASDLKKPDGLVEVKSERVQEFLRDLPIAKLWGVGKATAQVLKEMGILRIGQLADFPAAPVEKKLGKFGTELIALARGEDDRPVASKVDPKSISQEETFTPDLTDFSIMKRFLLEQAEQVGRQLRQGKMKGCTVQLKVRYPDFTLVTRSATLKRPTDQGFHIYQTAVGLLDRTDVVRKGARLLGVGVSNLRPRHLPEQPSLFDSEKVQLERSTQAMDRIWDKYGIDAIKRASLLQKEDPNHVKGRPDEK
jgi:DNA polymerase-4